MKVDAIWIYPVKGMRGISLPFSAVERRGLALDRRWLAVDDEGVFLSQRNTPMLAQIQAEPIPGNGLRLTHLAQTLDVFPGSRRESVTVWRDAVEALDTGDEAATWLSRVLGISCRLVSMDPQSVRTVDSAYGQPQDEVSFADGYPLLVVTNASLAALNDAIQEADPLQPRLPMERFRPNIVVDGTTAWAERSWTQIRIGTVPFRCVKPCARCLVTTTDQQTGERMGPEPLRTLTRLQPLDGKPIFGMNLIPDDVGTVSVGDPVTVIPT